MDAVRKLSAAYAERGAGPDQQTAKDQGNAYLTAKFPKLSYISKISLS